MTNPDTVPEWAIWEAMHLAGVPSKHPKTVRTNARQGSVKDRMIVAHAATLVRLAAKADDLTLARRQLDQVIADHGARHAG